MADDSKQKGAGASAPAASWTPKIGEHVFITETDKKHADQPVVSLLLVTNIGSTTAAKMDAKGKVVTEDKEFPIAGGKKVTRTVAVLETVPTFDGVLFSAQRQLPEPRRGVLIGALSPLEA